MSIRLSYPNKAVHYIVVLLVFFVTLLSQAQERQHFVYVDTPLIDVIQDIEKESNVSFSYAIDVVENKDISIDIVDVDWIEFLDILERQTGLIFKKISDTQVIVTPREVEGLVCGYVLDAVTQMPLSNIVVRDITGEQVYTNGKGYFEFKLDSGHNNAQPYTLSGLGYIEQEMTLTRSSPCIQVLMKLDNEALDEVIITAYVTSGIDRNKDGSIDVNQNALQILPGLVTPDLLQSIQLVPGISTLDESANGIQIRGGSPDQNLILFDNIKLFNTRVFIRNVFNP